jgi:predicted TIM-barrel fold metal-dependent hydrolase
MRETTQMSVTSSQPGRPPTIAGPDPHTRPPCIPLLTGACDCHAHVFGPQDRFAYLPNASYIPPDALPQDYARMLTTIGCQRAVLVQPSVYGTDNRCMVAAMTSGVFAFRGVAVVEEGISQEELEALHRAGVRGVRINVASKTAGLTMAQAPHVAMRIKPLGWHLQFFVRIVESPGFAHQIAQLPVACVIDHFGHVDATGGTTSPGFDTLLRLARLDHVWFKLIGPYRISTQGPRYPDVAPLARALVSVAPDRCVWGTDWPHPNTASMPNDGDLADALGEWLPDAAVRRKVLVDNPRRLYGFD